MLLPTISTFSPFSIMYHHHHCYCYYCCYEIGVIVLEPRVQGDELFLLLNLWVSSSVWTRPLCALFCSLPFVTDLNSPFPLYQIHTQICLLEYLNLHYFFKAILLYSIKNSTVPFSLRDHEHADENVVLESPFCHLLTRWLYANYVTLSFCIPCV